MSLFEGQVEQTPASIASRFRDDQLTYAQLNARANQLAHRLQKLALDQTCRSACYSIVLSI